jgi:hypothetical protein
VTTFNIKIMQILALQHCPRDFLSDFDYEDALQGQAFLNFADVLNFCQLLLMPQAHFSSLIPGARHFSSRSTPIPLPSKFDDF